MNPFRRNRKAVAIQTARPFVYLYLGKRYTFYALNAPDALKQVRECLSAKAAKEAQLVD